jgi:hypothetical protein
MIPNFDPILQLRRLKPQRTKEKSNDDFIPNPQKCHMKQSRTKFNTLLKHNPHIEQHRRIFNSEKSAITTQRSKCNRYLKGPKPHLTIQKKVHYRHMEVGAAEFVDGPVVYQSHQCYENKKVKRPVPLILNTLHHIEIG